MSKPFSQRDFDKAVHRILSEGNPCSKPKFHVGQFVELDKDFPSIGLKKGSRYFITACTPAYLPSKHCPKGIRESYQLNGSSFRIIVDHLKAVL